MSKQKTKTIADLKAEHEKAVFDAVVAALIDSSTWYYSDQSRAAEALGVTRPWMSRYTTKHEEALKSALQDKGKHLQKNSARGPYYRWAY
ncbi:MAG: hypothetical protein AAF429_14520 [Pseudomonadota bacterium]